MSQKLSDFKLQKCDGVGVFVEFNTKRKFFLDGLEKIEYKSFSNLKGVPRNNVKNGTSTIEELERYNQRHVYNRKKEINDLAYQNGCVDPWEYFVTLTFDKEMVDSYSHEEVTKYLSRWLNNQRKQNPDMKYLVVPELHKSGRIHFHGLFSHVPSWQLVSARSPKTGRKIYKNGVLIYNLTNYKLGYTTVSKVQSMERVSFYLSKYITKELLGLKNKKNVWHSKNLIKPGLSYHYVTSSELDSYISGQNVTYDKLIEKPSISLRFVTSRHNIYYAN